MKKIVSILVLVFAVTFTTQAQKKRGEKGPKLTAEQHTTLAVKKITLALDLTDKQQKQIKPILMAKMAERKASMEKRKEAKEKKQRPTADEMFAMKNKRLDNQIAMKKSMKNILNKEQFEKFEKMHKRKMKTAKNKMKGKKGKKHSKGKKRGHKSQDCK